MTATAVQCGDANSLAYLPTQAGAGELPPPRTPERSASGRLRQQQPLGGGDGGGAADANAAAMPMMGGGVAAAGPAASGGHALEPGSKAPADLMLDGSSNTPWQSLPYLTL